MKRSPPALIPFIGVFVTYGGEVNAKVAEFLDAWNVEYAILFGRTVDDVRAEFVSPDCPWRLGDLCSPGDCPTIQ